MADLLTQKLNGSLKRYSREGSANEFIRGQVTVNPKKQKMNRFQQKHTELIAEKSFPQNISSFKGFGHPQGRARSKAQDIANKVREQG